MRIFSNVASIYWAINWEGVDIAPKREIHRAFWSSFILLLECFFFKLHIYTNCKWKYRASSMLKGLVRNLSLRYLKCILKNNMFLYEKEKSICHHNHLQAILVQGDIWQKILRGLMAETVGSSLSPIIYIYVIMLWNQQELIKINYLSLKKS